MPRRRLEPKGISVVHSILTASSKLLRNPVVLDETTHSKVVGVKTRSNSFTSRLRQTPIQQESCPFHFGEFRLNLVRNSSHSKATSERQLSFALGPNTTVEKVTTNNQQPTKLPTTNHQPTTNRQPPNNQTDVFSKIEKKPNNGLEFNKTLGKALLLTTLGQSLRFTHTTRKSGLEPK